MIRFLVVAAVAAVMALNAAAADPSVIRSAKSGPWSAPGTWEGGTVPGDGARVQVREGHTVAYDIKSDRVIRSIHVAGTIAFTRDRDTRLCVGLIKIQPGEDASENGFDCDGHQTEPEPGRPQPTLQVGSAERPIEPNHTAVIRLTHVDGLDKQSCPAIACCGGRMDFHGTPMNRTWVKLGATANAGDTAVTIAEAVTGWRVGDRVILTATTKRQRTGPTLRGREQTEERTVTAVDGARLTLDKPLENDHQGAGAYRGEVANLSRNVVVESADPGGVRGHTMYHRNSAGSISYAEFRHLGKEGVLGRYSLHFHLCRDTMRGSSVIGASVWDSGNRWITVHGTNYLVVRDCVGYKSVGHGYFLEDGTEVYNVFDRNLAVLAYVGKKLPQQVLPFDDNDGSGFWWANSLNTFTRNVAAECDEYGFFFQAAKTENFDLTLPVQQPDGSRKRVDIRTLPFVRFDDNEAHCQRHFAVNLGGGSRLKVLTGPDVAGVGPDERHPFVVRNLKTWNTHWAIFPLAPSLLLDGVDIYEAAYGVWRPVYERHAYRNMHFDQVERHQYFTPGKKEGPPNQADDFPKPLSPVDDLPPTTVITHVRRAEDGKLAVRGSTADNGAVSRVVVNGTTATAVAANFAEWEAVVANAPELEAHAEDVAGNVEPLPHTVKVALKGGVAVRGAPQRVQPAKPSADVPPAAPPVVPAPAERPKASTSALHKAGEVVLEPAALNTPDGKIDYELGTLYVPENRADPKSRIIGVGFARFKAPQPTGAPPQFHLPGGPGNSFLNNLPARASDVKLYCRVSDVIYVDQRGFSRRGEVLTYHRTMPEQPLDQPGSLARATADTVAMARAAVADLTAKGVDLRGYTVKECADDVNDLRKALGYDRMMLVGTSFGSQWSFAIMRRHAEFVTRALLSGIEPLDYGYDMPSHVVAGVQRMWWEVEKDSRFRPYLPPGGMMAAAREVLKRLDREPARVAVKDDRSGETVTVVLGREDFQRDVIPGRPALLLSLYHGRYDEWAKAVLTRRRGREADTPLIGWLIDTSLHVTPHRAHLLRTDPGGELLGHWNFDAYMATAGVWTTPDVGDEFRNEIVSRIPVVFAQGDWDTQTPVENALNIAPFFPNGRALIALHGGHGVLGPIARNLPDVMAALLEFLQTGNTVNVPARVTLPVPKFDPPDFPPPANKS